MPSNPDPSAAAAHITRDVVRLAAERGTAWVGYGLEATRWLIGSIGFVVALSFSTSAAEMLHLFAPFLLLALAGTSGVEELLFSKQAATIAGREPSVYQRQSGFNNLALAATGLISFSLNWGPGADVALVTALLIFSTLSTVDHLWRALEDGQLRARCFIRLIGTVALWVVILPMLAAVARPLE